MPASNRDDGRLHLFGARLVRFDHVTDGGRVRVPHSSDARYCMSPDGRRWVRKRASETGFEALLAEALGWMLARELAVPVPDGAVTGEGDDLSWLSEQVPAVQHWDASRVHYIHNLEELGRMLTLDAIVFNEDRHARNILLQPAPTELELRAWSIDVGDSPLGRPTCKGARRGLSG